MMRLIVALFRFTPLVALMLTVVVWQAPATVNEGLAACAQARHVSRTFSSSTPSGATTAGQTNKLSCGPAAWIGWRTAAAIVALGDVVAGSLGSSEAAYRVGIRRLYGQGLWEGYTRLRSGGYERVVANEDDATRWFVAAAGMGHCAASMAIGQICLATGSFDDAAIWLQRAAVCSCGCNIEVDTMSARDGASLLNACRPDDKGPWSNQGGVQSGEGHGGGGKARSSEGTLLSHEARSICTLSATLAGHVRLDNHSDAVRASRAWQLASFHGDARATFALAMLMSEGHAGRGPNGLGALRARPGMAKRMIQRAAALGHTDAMFNLAVDAQVQKDWKAASTWYARAAVQGDTEAMSVLGSALVDGENLPVDLPAAATLLYCAAVTGDSAARNVLRHVVGRYGEVVVKGYADREACRRMLRAAGNLAGGGGSNDADAAAAVVAVASGGAVVPYQVVGQLAEVRAQESLRFPVVGVPASRGTSGGTGDDGGRWSRYSDMMELAANTAEDGKPAAAVRIYESIHRAFGGTAPLLRAAVLMRDQLLRDGNIFERPRRCMAGKCEDEETAASDLGAIARLLLAALREGDRNAIFEAAKTADLLGFKEEAVDLYLSAGETRHVDALFNLGFMYKNGTQLVPYDEHESDQYYRRAAECGDAEAMFQVALRVLDRARHEAKDAREEQGRVGEDGAEIQSANGPDAALTAERKIEAHAFLNVAGSRGIRCAEGEILALERLMSTPDIARANHAARRWRHVKACDADPEIIRREATRAAEIVEKLLTKAESIGSKGDRRRAFGAKSRQNADPVVVVV